MMPTLKKMKVLESKIMTNVVFLFAFDHHYYSCTVLISYPPVLKVTTETCPLIPRQNST